MKKIKDDSFIIKEATTESFEERLKRLKQFIKDNKTTFDDVRKVDKKLF